MLYPQLLDMSLETVSADTFIPEKANTVEQIITSLTGNQAKNNLVPSYEFKQ